MYNDFNFAGKQTMKKLLALVLLFSALALLPGCGGSGGTVSIHGTKIAFVSFRDGNSEVYVMNADGTGQTRLTNAAGPDTDPVFSPNGTKIAFVSTRDGYWEIYVMNADGTGQTNLTNDAGTDTDPVFN